MDRIKYHEIIIESVTHILVSTNTYVYDLFTSDKDIVIEDYVVDDYKESFYKNVELTEDKLFPVRLRTDNGDELYYVRSSKKGTGGLIRLVFVSADDLTNAHNSLEHLVSSYKAQLALYDDIYFEYSPDTGTVTVYNTEVAKFDSGVYSLDKFEDILCSRADDKQRSSVKNFINQIKTRNGRFSKRIDANIINDDASVKYTFLEGAYVFYSKDSEGIVGHIHLGGSGEKLSAATIKHDSLTGLVDKADIIRIARERIDERRLEGTTLAVIDIDYFKNVNDSFGHQVGDDVIKKIADIVSSEVGTDGIVGRFGGDEFLVVFYNIKSEEELREKLKSIKNMVTARFPDKGPEEATPLSVSIGTATFPSDADNYEDTFMLADFCLYVAKDKGRNRYIIYTLTKHGTLESIRAKRLSSKKLNERDLSYGDILVKMFDITLHGNGSTPEHFMDEFAEAFNHQEIVLFVGKPFTFRCSAGIDRSLLDHDHDFMLGFLNSEAKDKYIGNQTFIVVNRVDTLPPQANCFKEHLKEKGIFSYMMIRFYDKDGSECILVVGSIGKGTTWNQSHFKYYRAFADVLSLYSLRK